MSPARLRAALVAGLLAAALPAWAREPLPLAVSADFELTDHDGARRDGREFRGRPVIVYFGYASCPHSCGMALNAISAALDELGSRAAEVTALFVTVDPGRDTPSRMSAFLEKFHPAIVGLTGGADEIARVRRDFGVAARRIEESGRFERLYEHGTFLYLLDADGELQSILPPILPPGRLAALLRDRL